MAGRLGFWQRQRDKGRKVDTDIFTGAESELNPELKDVVECMRIAKIYNHFTGANLSHFDVMKWGWRDEVLIINAMNYLAKVK